MISLFKNGGKKTGQEKNSSGKGLPGKKLAEKRPSREILVGKRPGGEKTWWGKIVGEYTGGESTGLRLKCVLILTGYVYMFYVYFTEYCYF